MSDYNWDDESLEPDDNNLVKRLRAEIEKRDKALKQRDEEFGKLQGEVRRQSVGNLLREMGVKPKVANLIPSDVEPTADAVKAWVTEYEDIFGSVQEGSSAKETNPAPDPEEPKAPPSIPSEQVEAWTRLQSQDASAGSTIPTGDDAQLQWLARAAKAADGDADRYFDILRGELSP
jgi:hypothetical protein